MTFALPIVHSTVNAASGRGKPTVPGLLEGAAAIDRASDGLGDGCDVSPAADAIGGTSVEAHRAGLERVFRAGGAPISWVSLACELQRDWARLETVPAVVEIVLTERLLQEPAAREEVAA